MELVIGKNYEYFDNGVKLEKRKHDCKLVEIIKFADIDENVLHTWEKEVETNHWLYEKETDLFLKVRIKGVCKAKEYVYFVRAQGDMWFSIGWFSGLLREKGLKGDYMKKDCISCKEYLHCKRPYKKLAIHDCSFFNGGGAFTRKNNTLHEIRNSQKIADINMGKIPTNRNTSDLSENSKNQENTFCHQGSIEVKPRLDRITERLIFDVEEKINDMVVNHYKDVLNFKEKTVKDALIALGWTPPEEKTVSSNEMQMQKDFAIKKLGEKEISTVCKFMDVDIKEFTKEELIKILSLQQRKWLESIGFKYEE